MQSFAPNNASLQHAPWTTVQLSQRDVSLQIPIDFITQPAVSLSAACFGKGTYDEEAAKRCISNLLSVGYRRLYVDLYWSVGREKWDLCPATIPADGSGLTGQADISTRRSSYGTLLYQLGPYACSANVDLAGLISVISGYFSSTEDTLSAHLTYMIFNLHAASSPGSPGSPAPAPTENQFPSALNSLGATVDRTLGRYIYTPSELDSERKNLNRSWYSVSPSLRPIAEYFSVEGVPDSRHRTTDGWPGEGYLEISKAQRLLLGWGKVDAQMSEYDFDADNQIIFSSSSISSFVTVTKNNDSDIISECLYNPDSTDINRVADWATAEIPIGNSSSQLAFFTNQMVACGISPLVNYTLLNATADQNIEPYRNVSLSSIWSWAVGQPESSVNSAMVEENRCSVMDLSLAGHWRATDCTDRLYAACRVADSPYKWVLSREPEAYVFAKDTCPENSSFAVPRTTLENTYLYEYLLKQPKDLIDSTSDETEKRNVWLDFNSLDVPNCWVSGGPKAQCPYEVDESAIERRNILVPSIAAIIILIITALTLFVKCNANRRNSRRRRVIEGWEYEGVPS
ncbi:predicted protein [Uncinocarpus reesii 1704]|uniref:Maintenance of telomere capping protein 6 n=1 Tax=Uncinocarpus reesii (strain UAMH 1704) TaxID=336963 RepID=C4JXQ0_UNCRE|nr:uncharacterized protein UREG_06423 [Uncinocarpus reesii 1704]EEP81558.1 predicted protein [Uncinocarpus reesii 1704]